MDRLLASGRLHVRRRLSERAEASEQSGALRRYPAGFFAS